MTRATRVAYVKFMKKKMEHDDEADPRQAVTEAAKDLKSSIKRVQVRAFAMQF